MTETVGVHSDVTMEGLSAPFPWFGGKRRAADLVWQRFGSVANYVEPFAGSLAVLLARPTPPRVETVNDIDCYLANFWRALQADAEGVADWADGPVNEADLHARHTWLVSRDAFRERMKTDPEYFDVKIAGWWVWGLCLWIGTGWCKDCELRVDGTPRKKLPMSGHFPGVHRSEVAEKIPNLTSGFGNGTGVHVSRQVPDISRQGTGIHASGIHAYLASLALRLRRVRVVCGDWRRVCTPAVTSGIGLTGVLLDPPYDGHEDFYAPGGVNMSTAVRAWALFRGDDPDMRIAICGYDGEHEMPETWACIPWKAQGGYGSQRKDGTNENAARERIWFSPHCLKPGLFAEGWL